MAADRHRGEKSFSPTITNRLNKAHRPQYLLSGLLQCAHYLGPHAIAAKDRYGCTNRQKKLPIEQLGGIVCTNSEIRLKLEERIVAAVPGNLLGADYLEPINRDIAAAATRDREQASAGSGRLRSEIAAIEKNSESSVRRSPIVWWPATRGQNLNRSQAHPLRERRATVAKGTRSISASDRYLERRIGCIGGFGVFFPTASALPRCGPLIRL
ncbi:hypothetical protein GA0061105_1114 [Rhizobium aethiopicum]|uniref:Uncharacterized protein n=1 Tax=Rhizobium aethiopicum TaxID=1138170 RepID=A0A1C3Y7P7_9HYPH|nr:hypothetical protein [Rhizobium aethiopicum]SCB60433.1 hypothetical protein GA0061105_1114 [Rhizobium aethiopicum]